MKTAPSGKVQSNALRELAKRGLINWMEKRSEELPVSAASITEEELNIMIHEERNKEEYQEKQPYSDESNLEKIRHISI